MPFQVSQLRSPQTFSKKVYGAGDIVIASPRGSSSRLARTGIARENFPNCVRQKRAAILHCISLL